MVLVRYRFWKLQLFPFINCNTEMSTNFCLVIDLSKTFRQRITKVTSGSVRQAVVTAYVRGDVLGVRGGCRSWARMSGSLTSPQPQLLAQASARLINALTAFTAGRSYLARWGVSLVLQCCFLLFLLKCWLFCTVTCFQVSCRNHTSFLDIPV